MSSSRHALMGNQCLKISCICPCTARGRLNQHGCTYGAELAPRPKIGQWRCRQASLCLVIHSSETQKGSGDAPTTRPAPARPLHRLGRYPSRSSQPRAQAARRRTARSIRSWMALWAAATPSGWGPENARRALSVEVRRTDSMGDDICREN